MSKLLLSTKNTELIPVEISDAEFIYSLRIDSRLNKHISSINGTIIDQARWIEDYKKREKNNEEFYFIIKRTDNDKKIGTIRLYDITKDNGFCWGSWILNEDKMKSSAIESAYLIYKFGFYHKKYKFSYFQVDKKNKEVIAFHKKTGAAIIKEDEVNYHFEFHMENFIKLKEKYSKYI